LWISPAFCARYYCEYHNDPDYGFGCELSFINLTADLRTDDISFSGTLDQKKQVQLIHIRESTVSYLPHQILTYFPNMVNLAIWDSKLDLSDINLFQKFTHLKKLSLSSNQIETLDEKSLSLLENLELIGLQNNKIELLNGDIFANNKKLTYIGFKNNKIYMIDPTIFDPLNHLEVVDFRNNICVDENFFITNGQLNTMQSSLRKCFENFYLTRFIADSQKKELLKITSYLDMMNEKLNKLAKKVYNESEDDTWEAPVVSNPIKESSPLMIPNIYIPPITMKPPETDTEKYDEEFDFYEFTTQKTPQATTTLQLTIPQQESNPLQYRDRIISKFDDILNSSQNRMKTLNERKSVQKATTPPDTADYYDYDE
jgi:hypothetical protein